MQFLNLSALYLFSLLGLILVFYLLKGRRRDLHVPSTMLWQQIIQDYSSPRPRYRIRPEWLLFLQLLVLTVLILAWLQPVFFASMDTTRRVVLVMDGSASMQATDIVPNRFTHGIETAVAQVEQMSSETEIALVLAAGQSRVITEFSRDHTQIIEDLRSLSVTDTPLDLTRLIEISEVLLANEQRGEIRLFTDGAYLPFTYDGRFDFQIVQGGADTGNVGITELDVRMSTGHIGEYHVFAEVTNFSYADVTIPLTISQGGRIILRDTIQLEPEESKSAIYPIQAMERAIYQVTLHTDDALALDNQVYLPLGLADGLRVLLVSSGNFFLERALLTIPNIRLFTKSIVTGAEIDLYDLVIFDRITPPQGVRNNAVFIHAVPPELDSGVTLARQPAILTDWRNNHALLRFVDLSELRVRSQLRLQLPQDFHSIISSVHGPLLSVYEQPDFRWVLFTFNLDESNLPLQVGFPILWSNIISWFYPQFFDANYAMVRSGDSFEVPRRPWKVPSGIENPRQEPASVYSSPRGYLVQNTNYQGVYTVDMFDHTQDFFVANLLSKQESDLRPQVYSQQLQTVDSGEAIASTRAIWFYLVLFVISLLVVEGYLYHRPQVR